MTETALGDLMNIWPLAPALLAGWLGIHIGIGRADAPPSYRDRVLQTDHATLRYFPMSDAGGLFLEDASPAQGHAALAGTPQFGVTGPHFPPGSTDSAMSFGAGDTYAAFTLPEFSGALNSPTGATVSCWFRTPSSASRAVVGTFNLPSSEGGFQLALGTGRYWNLSSGVEVSFAVSEGPGVFRSASILAPPIFDDSDWHMFAATYRLGDICVFFDGRCITPTTAGAGALPTVPDFTGPIGIGAVMVNGTAQSLARCDLAQVSLHATALSSTQLQALYETGMGYAGQALYNGGALAPWWEAARQTRVDAMFLGDSNCVITADGMISGHFTGMSRALRARFPIYASAVLPGLGTGGWGNTINAISPLLANAIGSRTPPAFVSDQLPPRAQGFPSAAAYAADDEVIPGGNAWRGPIFWDSPDFLFDFTRDVDFHFTYATFAEGNGVIRPRIQLNNYPFTPLVSTVIPTAPSQDAVIDTLVPIPAGPRAPGQPYTIQINDYLNNLDAEGPFAFMYSRLVLPHASSGVSITPLWCVGAQGAKHAAASFTRQATTGQLGAYLRQAVRHQPAGEERLLVQILEGGNDSNDPGWAIESDGSDSGFRSFSATGQKTNTRTILHRIRAAWIAEGYQSSRLHFLLGPYHPADTTGAKLRYAYVRGWRELAIEHPDWNIAVMDGFGVSSVTEFMANGWFETGGQAHLSHDGYIHFAELTWQAVADALADDSPGACCRGSICVIEAGAGCSEPGTRFVGTGTVCNAPGQFSTPCCRADFTQSQTISVDDLFQFIAAYFGGDARVDINDSGVISVQDIFDFLKAYFEGC